MDLWTKHWISIEVEKSEELLEVPIELSHKDKPSLKEITSTYFQEIVGQKKEIKAQELGELPDEEFQSVVGLIPRCTMKTSKKQKQKKAWPSK